MRGTFAGMRGECERVQLWLYAADRTVALTDVALAFDDLTGTPNPPAAALIARWRCVHTFSDAPCMCGTVPLLLQLPVPSTR